MKKYPKLRCPVCGMVVWFRNLVKFHKIEAFEYQFGIGKGKIKVNKAVVTGSLIDYWIKRLEEVIDWLKSLKETSLTYQIKCSNVSETFALQKTESKSLLTKTITLNVPKHSVNISYQTKK